MDSQPLYDLHSHTTASDGTLSPRELVRLAKQSGLRALAVTDHDTVDGLSEAVAEAEDVGVELVPGIEVSATFEDVPVHVLGLFIAYQEPWLVDFFGQARKRRIERVHEIVRKLAKVDVHIDAAKVLAHSSHGTVGRPHVAQALVDEGIVGSLKEAFDLYLADDGPAFVGYEKVTFQDATDLIHRAGGVSSLAHPVLMRDDTAISRMVDENLQALEVFHKDHSEEKASEYLDLTGELDLLVTGGSDFHRPELDGERGLGCAELTEDAFERVRAAAGSTR